MMRLGFLAVVGMLACGPSQPMFSQLPSEQREPIQTYVFEHPRAIVLQAAYDALSNAGFVIQTFDREGGLVGTDYMEVSDTPMSVGASEDLLLRPIRAKVNILITAVDSASTRVKLNILLQYKPSGWQELPRNENQMRSVYAKYFGLIQKELL